MRRGHRYSKSFSKDPPTCDQDVELVGNQLLTHVRQYFEEAGTDRVFSCDLCDWLNGLEDGGYSSWSHGKGITQKRLARELRHYDISPDSIRGESGTKKGYLKAWFKDAFERYLDTEGRLDPNSNRNNGTRPENTVQNSEVGEGTRQRGRGASFLYLWGKFWVGEVHVIEP